MADIVTISTTEYTVTIQQGDTQTVVVTPAPEQVVTISTDQGIAPYTDADARAALSASGQGLSYNDTTGVFTFVQPVVAIDKGGTGATTASAARTALGVDNAANLSTGTLDNDRISNLPVSKLLGTLQNSQVSESNVTQHADAVAAAIDLGDLNNVNIPTLTDGQVLAYDQSTDKWIASSPAGGGVTDHGALTGLGDDDHTQYALADGTRGNFAATSHTHAASEITSGSLSIDLTPSADLTYSIGTEAARWLDIHGDLDGAVTFRAKNASGGTLTVGDIVYISGVSGSVPTVDLADCSNSAKMPAFGMVRDASVGPNNETHIATLGSVESVDVPSGTYTLGTNVYVGTAGTFTDSPPTGEGNLIQNIGWVARVNTGGGPSGIIKVGGAGRTNAVPNLNSGNIFYGNGSNQATSVALTSVAAAASHTHALGDLSDVDTAGATTGQVLEFDGADWVPATPSAGAAALNDLTDVSTAGATTGDVIVYNGSTWAPAAQSGGSGGGEIVSDAENGVGENSVTNIIAITQAEYDALTPQADTFYIITDATAGTDYTTSPEATTVRLFDDMTSIGISNLQSHPSDVCYISGSSWSWRGNYYIGGEEFDGDDAIGVLWAQESGQYDRGTLYGPISVLRYAPSDGDKCLFECRIKFNFAAGNTASYLAVGFISWLNNASQGSTDVGTHYTSVSMAGVKFNAGNTYLKSFVKDNYGVAGGPTFADITSVSVTNDTWYRIGVVCTYDAANTRWVVTSYIDGTLVDTQYLTTWGPPPTYGICCYQNNNTQNNLYYVDWVSCEYTRWTTPTLLHIEDV